MTLLRIFLEEDKYASINKDAEVQSKGHDKSKIALTSTAQSSNA